ncbi:B12-binding domain-containing radical SAM protein [Halonatronum saccharophilum]|uniref:B12-binding domain-containing radical SAM protein n=1 Tax=Halonatronum saccharophilum TaxID=150060 RepID=UPI0004871447|nr:B12-binding domain-containing radical SAM protein [Halonatronum saccharophilum]
MKTLLTTLNAKFIHSSLALRYLKAYCGDEFDIRIREYTINQHTDELLGEIYREGCDLVGFSCYIWNIGQTLELIRLLKKVQPNIKVLLGGPEVSYDGYKLMEEYEEIDYIIFGEGELSFKELLGNLRVKKDLSKVDGLIYRKGSKVVENKAREVICDLDIIPSPYESLEGLDNKIIYFESNRGCPFNCQYCLSSTLSSVRFFSLDRVKSDLLKLIESGVKQVKFVDRTFNANSNYAMEVFRFLLDQWSEGLDINFHFEITADLMSKEMIELLSKAPKGYFQFEIGVQSTNKETLKLIDRRMDLKRLSKVVRDLNSYNNIHLHLDLIAALPKEDYNTFKESFNFVYDLKPGKLQLGFLKLLKGSGLRRRANEYGYIWAAKPPYEVLESNSLSYGEMLKLKMVEEVLETFSNSHHFDYSIEYIKDNFYATPFDLFEDLAKFWEEKGYYRYPHKLESLYKYLQEFYREYCVKEEDIFNEILKFDYLLRRRKVDIPDFFNKYEVDDYKDKFNNFTRDKEMIDKYLPDLSGFSARQIRRKIQIESFKYDILNVIDGSKEGIKEGLIAILFNYSNKEGLFNKANFSRINLS